MLLHQVNLQYRNISERLNVLLQPRKRQREKCPRFIIVEKHFIGDRVTPLRRQVATACSHTRTRILKSAKHRAAIQVATLDKVVKQVP